MVKRRDFKEDSLIMSAIEKLTVLLASSAAIVHGFLIYDLAEQYSIYYCNSCLISHQISEVSFCSKNIVMPADDVIASDIHLYSALSDGDGSNKEVDMEMVKGYEDIHPDIANMLIIQPSQHTKEPCSFVVDESTLTLQRREITRAIEQSTTDMNIVSIDILASLADESDNTVFNNSTYDVHTSTIPKKMSGLIELSQLSNESACMVALNLLESSIRSVVMNSNNQTGRRGAPLLSDMIQTISELDNSAADLAPILRALLLPTRMGGINLRNLISHGFLYTIERRWFSLTLVLIQTLDTLNGSYTEEEIDQEEQGKINHEAVDPTNGKSSLREYEPLAIEVRHGEHILFDKSKLRQLELHADAFIPSSHMPLLRFSLENLAPTIQQSSSSSSLTAIFTTVICSLLEHSLRLMWCDVNNRPRDCIARPSEYYVTLDGHGQRDKHEVMLTPYLSDGKTRNELIPTIGADVYALLADLFTSPLDNAHNIRAAICHGSWDEEILQELESLATTGDSTRKSNPLLLDAACALVSCLDYLISSAARTETGIPELKQTTYRPVFTYTSAAVRNLIDIQCDLANLDLLITNNTSIAKFAQDLERQGPKLSSMMQLQIDLESIETMACELLPTMLQSDDEGWEVHDVYSEYQTNILLADNIAAFTLLLDVAKYTKNYLREIEGRVDSLTIQPSSTKDRRILKTATRFCSVATIIGKFYVFATYVALVALKNETDTSKSFIRKDMIRAVERTRMTLSTFDSYLATNNERSIKALEQYLQGKEVKKIIAQKNLTAS